MNHRVLFIVALILALLLHSGAGILMLHDEKSRIREYQQAPIQIQLIPEAQFPPESPAMIEQEEASALEEIEREATQESSEPTADKPEETTGADAEENVSKEETSDSEHKKIYEEAKYHQNISKGGDLMRENILPPREEGGYSRTVSTDQDPYQKLVEDAIALLEDTPFLDKEWKDEPTGEEDPTYYSPEFIDLLKHYNPTEPIRKEETPDNPEAPTPEEAEVSDIDQFGNPKPVTLIVNHVAPQIDIAKIEEIAKKKEAEKERIHNTNIINAAGSQIRRQEYNVSLASSQCYDTYIKGSNRKYSAIVMIFDNPKGTGIYKSTGNLQLDTCIIEMTNQFIQIPAEMERIRKNAPRMGNGKGYLLNASF